MGSRFSVELLLQEFLGNPRGTIEYEIVGFKDGVLGNRVAGIISLGDSNFIVGFGTE